MAILKSTTLTLGLFLLSTLTFTIQSEDIHQILRTYGLPPGLFPDTPHSAHVDDNSGQLSVHLDLSTDHCYVRFPHVSYFDSIDFSYEEEITGRISRGVIEDIEGMAAKLTVETAWSRVTRIEMIYSRENRVMFSTGLAVLFSPLSSDFMQIPRCQPSVKPRVSNIRTDAAAEV